MDLMVRDPTTFTLLHGRKYYEGNGVRACLYRRYDSTKTARVSWLVKIAGVGSDAKSLNGGILYSP